MSEMLQNKRGVMGYPTKALPDPQNAWHDALISIRPDDRSLYIHIPFCRTRCPFCPFYLACAKETEMNDYVNLLIKELKNSSEFEGINGLPFNTVYFGGGTPTDLNPKQIEKLLQTIFKYYRLSNDCEITLEGRVNGFTKEKMLAAVNNGINRFSLGIQSFDTKLRKSIGRLDNKETLISTLNQLSSLNQASVVIDLLYGIPGQTLDSWLADIKTALTETQISGLDLYRMNIYEGLEIDKMIKRGNSPPPLSDKELFEMYKQGSQMMDDFGAARLSIHHYAINYRERNAYNELGSKKATCIQFGMKAGGRIGKFFFRQCTDFCEYRKMISLNKKPLSYAGEFPDDFYICAELNHQIVKYRIVNLTGLLTKYPQHSDKVFKLITLKLEKMKNDGLLINSSLGYLKMTEKAIFNYKEVAADLMETIAAAYSNKE